MRKVLKVTLWILSFAVVALAIYQRNQIVRQAAICEREKQDWQQDHLILTNTLDSCLQISEVVRTPYLPCSERERIMREALIKISRHNK